MWLEAPAGDLEPGRKWPSSGAVKGMAMHEVGHTLGLRHNFRASRALHAAAARRSGLHRANNGVAGSVMDYPA